MNGMISVSDIYAMLTGLSSENKVWLAQHLINDVRAEQPYTMAELDARLDEAEAEVGGMSCAEFVSTMEQKYPWLCK